jgi:transglutaminase superfamily protein
MGTWRTFSRLTKAERLVALEAAFGLTSTWIALRTVGFRRWRKVLESLATRKKTNAPTTEVPMRKIANVVRMEEAAARNLFFDTNCLEQSLVLWWLLQKRGVEADLLIGARKDANRFEAHAWVEFAGAALNSTGEGHLHFVPFEEQITWMGTN